MSDMQLHEAVQEFLARIGHVTDRMHEAVYSANIDEQLAALAAIVGLTEMLKSVAENWDSHGGSDPA